MEAFSQPSTRLMHSKLSSVAGSAEMTKCVGVATVACSDCNAAAGILTAMVSGSAILYPLTPDKKILIVFPVIFQSVSTVGMLASEVVKNGSTFEFQPPGSD